MIIIGIVLAFIGLAYLCWLVFVLAIYALPFFAGASAGLATYHSGSGPIAVIIVGAIAGSITLYCRADRLHDAVLAPHSRSDRAPLCSAGRRRGISCRARPRPHRHICHGWRETVAVAGAIIVAATAWARMVLSAPRSTPDKALPPA